MPVPLHAVETLCQIRTAAATSGNTAPGNFHIPLDMHVEIYLYIYI